MSGIAGIGISADAKGTGNYSTGVDESKVMNAALNFAQSEEFQSNFQKIKDYATSQAYSSSNDEGVRLSQDFTESLNKVKNYQEAHQGAKSQLDQVSDTSAWYQQNSHLIKDNLNQKYVDWAVEKFNDQYQDGTGFDRFKELTDSSDPNDVCQVQGLVYEFVQSQMDRQSGISNPSRYQDPGAAYENAHIARVDEEKKSNQIFDEYAHSSEGLQKTYGSIQENKEGLDQSFEKEANGMHDAYAYFTKNGIDYHRKAAINQFDIEREKSLPTRVWNKHNYGKETSTDYQLYVPFFWRRDE